MSQFYHPDTGTQPTPVVKPEQSWQTSPYPPPPSTYYPAQTPILPTQPTPPSPRKPRSRLQLAGLIAMVCLVAIVVSMIWHAYYGSPALSHTDATATASAQVALTATALANENATVAAGINALSNDLTQTAMTPTAVPTPQSSPQPTFATFTDGTYQIGIDIQPGTYRTRTGSQGCYYARLKGFSGLLDDILANNNTDDPAIVTILPGDKGFTSENCGTWTKDLSQITDSMTTFLDGMYIVGTDIKPGTYKSSGGQGCYYARLNNFTGSLYSIIANNNTDNVAIVTIYTSDKGFESTRCGTWTKI